MLLAENIENFVKCNLTLKGALFHDQLCGASMNYFLKSDPVHAVTGLTETGAPQSLSLSRPTCATTYRYTGREAVRDFTHLTPRLPSCP
jgi:hypothetical protein